MIFKIFTLNLLVLIKLCSCANILAVFVFPGFSHFTMFKPVLMELANRGHNVDVVSHFPLTTPIERYTDISIRGSFPILTNNMTVESLRNPPGSNLAQFLILEVGIPTCKVSFNTPQLQVLKQSKKKYDLVISELFASDCMLGWGWYFGVPNVVMTSSVNLPWATDRFGLPDNPAYIPNYFGGYFEGMNLYERIVNTYWSVYSKLLYKIYENDPANELARQFFGPQMPDLQTLVQNTSLQLVNSHFSVNIARPTVPNVIEVAGVHIGKPQPVDKHTDEILTNDKNGIIYFTMGSLILIESLPDKTAQALFDALSQLPYKVLWKGNREKIPKTWNVPANIHFEFWMPQLDILCDPRVKLFISHGGLMGNLESLYCGVPILGIPLFGDQMLNVRQAQTAGYALMVNYDEITKENILDAAKKLLFDPTYKSNAEKTSAIFKDRPLSAMDTAIFWIEYVIRHGGAPKLQSNAKFLAWYQYYLFDVIIITVAIPLGLTYLLLRIMLTSLRKKSSTKLKTK